MISEIILLSSFLLIAAKRTKSYIKVFKMQSLLIAAATALLGFEYIEGGEGINILIVCVLIILIKVIYIPKLLVKTYTKVTYKTGKDYFLSIPMLIIISSLIVVITYYLIASMIDQEIVELDLLIINSVSIVMIGFLFMITRKKALDQIIGYLVIENGIFITAMYSTNGMPLIVDIGIFIDLISAILITGIMIYRMNEKFESTDLNKMRSLRG